MLRGCLVLALTSWCWTLPSSCAYAQTRAVIELFTSQGCSSCPPADKLLGDLASDPSIVAISVPIDYWDYLGWKDTLADPHNTARQKAYAHTRGDGQVYTPQAVVNGSVHALGSDKAAIEQAIARSRKEGAMSLAPITLAFSGGRISLVLPETEGAETGEAWLYGLVHSVTIPIARGENKGRTVTYHNVARRWVKLGDWSGHARSWSVPAQTLSGEGIDGAAVLVQMGTPDKPKTILGAAFAALH
ncbi:MAG TPA: DUF1223 domain-containing protein [Xanthobacteraceae bacterium]|jgi:hypothetical protein